MERLSDNLAIYRAFVTWRSKLRHVKDMSSHVLAFRQRQDKLLLLRYLYTWRGRADLKGGEQFVTRVIDLRLISTSWHTWSHAAWVVFSVTLSFFSCRSPIQLTQHPCETIRVQACAEIQLLCLA